ncbi:MAG: glycosyltransferase family 9 protein [Burkholderiaceae bacterium]
MAGATLGRVDPPANRPGRDRVAPWGSDATRRCRALVASAGADTVLPRLSLADCASLLGRAQAVVGVDTGLTPQRRRWIGPRSRSLPPPRLGDSVRTGLRGPAAWAAMANGPRSGPWNRR